MAFSLPQLVQLLRGDSNGMIQRFLFTAAARSNVFAYNLVCILKASSSPTNISLSMLSHIEWLENTALAEHCMKCVARYVVMLWFHPYILLLCSCRNAGTFVPCVVALFRLLELYVCAAV